MREILFRGQKAIYGGWVYGSLAVKTDSLLGIKTYFILNQEPGKDGLLEPLVSWHNVKPETVGQYTGLTDKNGKRIFEGDIVHIWVDYDDDEPIKKYRAIVEFGNPNHEYNWGYQLKMIDTMSHNEDILLWVEMEDGGAFCEVIGNIHGNPELMKDE